MTSIVFTYVCVRVANSFAGQFVVFCSKAGVLPCPLTQHTLWLRPANRTAAGAEVLMSLGYRCDLDLRKSDDRLMRLIAGNVIAVPQAMGSGDFL